MELIPAIDLLGGQCVRLLKGDFQQVSVYDVDVVSLAIGYRQAGARHLHVVDLDGAKTGSPANAEPIRRLASESGLKVQVGGGIRTLARAHELLNTGACRVVVGSVAAEQPTVASEWLAELGPERMVLALDIRWQSPTEPTVLTRGWISDTGVPLWDLVERFAADGARYFLCTDVSRDGTLAGPNLALYRQCHARYPALGFIASGGISGYGDLTALRESGIAAAVSGKALLDGRLTLAEMEQFSRNA